MAFPAGLGDLGISILSLHSDWDFSATIRVTAPLKKAFISLSHKFSYEGLNDQLLAKSDIIMKGMNSQLWKLIA